MLLEERERESMRASWTDRHGSARSPRVESYAELASRQSTAACGQVRTGQPDVSSSESSERVSLVERTHLTGCRSGEVCRRHRDGPSSLSKRSYCMTSHITTKG